MILTTIIIWLGPNSTLTKPAYKVMGATLYKLFSALIFILCETWVLPNTPVHAQHYLAWYVDINGRWPRLIGSNTILEFRLDLTQPLQNRLVR
jgi:hypothetical protein